MFRLFIQTGNDAFRENRTAELVRIIREVADKLEEGNRFPPVVDSNGNSVGRCSWVRR
jgi:hypothetical protein